MRKQQFAKLLTIVMLGTTVLALWGCSDLETVDNTVFRDRTYDYARYPVKVSKPLVLPKNVHVAYQPVNQLPKGASYFAPKATVNITPPAVDRPMLIVSPEQAYEIKRKAMKAKLADLEDQLKQLKAQSNTHKTPVKPITTEVHKNNQTHPVLPKPVMTHTAPVLHQQPLSSESMKPAQPKVAVVHHPSVVTQPVIATKQALPTQSTSQAVTVHQPIETIKPVASVTPHTASPHIVKAPIHHSAVAKAVVPAVAAKTAPIAPQSPGIANEVPVLQLHATFEGVWQAVAAALPKLGYQIVKHNKTYGYFFIKMKGRPQVLLRLMPQGKHIDVLLYDAQGELDHSAAARELMQRLAIAVSQ